MAGVALSEVFKFGVTAHKLYGVGTLNRISDMQNSILSAW